MPYQIRSALQAGAVRRPGSRHSITDPKYQPQVELQDRLLQVQYCFLQQNLQLPGSVSFISRKSLHKRAIPGFFLLMTAKSCGFLRTSGNGFCDGVFPSSASDQKDFHRYTRMCIKIKMFWLILLIPIQKFTITIKKKKS